MPYDLEFTQRFLRVYRRKTAERQKEIKRTLELLCDNPRHPGLQTHRIQGARGVWECYMNTSLRITFEYAESSMILRNNCTHDSVLRSP